MNIYPPEIARSLKSISSTTSEMKNAKWFSGNQSLGDGGNR
jgi:hypothetical protein